MEKAQKGMEAAFENLRVRAEQSVRTYDNLTREEKAKAIEQGIQEEDMTEQEALRQAKQIAEAVRSLAQDLEAPDLQVRSLQRYDETEIAGFRQWAKSQTDNLWSQSPDVAKQEALAREQRDLANLKGHYEATKGRETNARQERDTLVRQNGDQTALAASVEERRRKVSDLDNRTRQLNRRANLVREATEYLRGVAAGGAAERCPLCASHVPNLLAHLRSEWEESISKEVPELESERQLHVFQIEGLESLISKLARLEKNLQEATSDLTACLSQVALALGREIGREDDPGALMSARLREIAAELDRIGQAIERKRQRISG